MARLTANTIRFRCISHESWPIVVTGNVPELGHWNPGAGLPMQLEVDTGDRREWVATEKLPDGTALEFKFVAKTDQMLRWEAGDNRVAVVGTDSPQTTGEFRH